MPDKLLRAVVAQAMSREMWPLVLGNPRLIVNMSTRLRFLRKHGNVVYNPLVKRNMGVRFEFDFNLDPMVWAMYAGTYEMPVVEIMRSTLKQGDKFIDVGANIGYLSALAAGFVGRYGEVHSFEPVPEYFERLRSLAEMNSDFKIVANQAALGDEPGQAEIDVGVQGNIGMSTMVPHFMPLENCKASINVPVLRLDQYIKGRSLGRIALIKIDTEGFESHVLRGLEGYFREASDLPPIICEIMPRAYPLLDHSVEELVYFMKANGYAALDLVNKKRVDVTRLKEVTNVFFKPQDTK